MSQGRPVWVFGTDDLNIKITIQVLGRKGQSAQMLLQPLLLGDSQLSPLPSLWHPTHQGQLH